MLQAWCKLRLRDIDQGLQAELGEHELPVLEELLGKCDEKLLVLDVLAREAEVSILGSGQMSVDLEQNFERDGSQGRRLWVEFPPSEATVEGF